MKQVKEYVPFGPEWEKEVMKFNKKYLVAWLRNKLMVAENDKELNTFKTLMITELKDYLYRRQTKAYTPISTYGSQKDFIEGYEAAIEDLETILK